MEMQTFYIDGEGNTEHENILLIKEELVEQAKEDMPLTILPAAIIILN